MGFRANEVEEILSRTVEMIVDHLRRSCEADAPVSDRLDPQALHDSIDFDLPHEGVDLAALEPVIRGYLEHATRTSHPRFLNQLFSGHDIPGIIGEFVASASNTSMYTYEVAPVATLMEQELLRTMRGMVGFDEGEGILVPGGSNANMVAMLMARQRHSADSKRLGLGDTRYDAFVSDQAHYSFLMGANVLGIGTDAVIPIESDATGRMIPEKLEAAIERSRIAGRTPFFVAATAGTTVLGAFDPIAECTKIARRHGLWMHVDGAWGAPVLFSRRHRALIDGCADADSFAWDAHKLMGVPLTCTAILLRESGQLAPTCATSGTDYIYHDNPNESYDLGPLSLACGRKVDSLKLWLAWKHHGGAGYERRVDHLMELAAAARRHIDAHPHLELQAEPSYLNLCFRYAPQTDASHREVDRLNQAIRDDLADSGSALVNYALIGDRVTIRLVLPNPELTESLVTELLNEVATIGRRLEAEGAWLDDSVKTAV